MKLRHEASNERRQSSQLEKFKDAARQLETDEDEARFEENLGKRVKKKPSDQDGK